MLIFRTRQTLQEYLATLPADAKIGLVATMGALHRGHISLVRRSLKKNQVTVCSIYVNPTQFNDSKDFTSYPKTEAADLKVLEKTGCQVVFMPETKELYPCGIDNLQFTIDFGNMSRIMEGKHRPGHFSGVAIVVAKLFNIIRPHRAYFGKKDYQQSVIIKCLAQELDFGVEIISCPIVREKSGLALSSRNQKLSSKARTETAPLIYKTLVDAKKHWHNGAQVDVIKAFVQHRFSNNSSLNLEYFEIVAAETLQPIIPKQADRPEHVVFCIAAFLESVRLIDNLKS